MSKQSKIGVLVSIGVFVVSLVLRPVNAFATTNGVVIQTPRSGGVNIDWTPTASDHNLELMFVVATGMTPSLTVLSQTQIVDTNTLPIVDDHSDSANSAVMLGQVVRARGQTLVGVIVQPRFQKMESIVDEDGNEVAQRAVGQRLTRISFNVNNVTYLEDVKSLRSSRPFLQKSQGPRAFRANEWRIVTQSGWQRLRGSDLIAAGLPVKSRNLVKLELRQGSQVIPLLLDGLEDFQIDANDEIVFYAPPVQSRWQRNQTFWLRIGSGAGRININEMPRVTVSAATQASEVVMVRNPQTYEPKASGSRGEYWFSQRIRLDSSMPDSEIIQLTPRWRAPVAPGAQIKATVSGYTHEDTAGPHVLALNDSEMQWEGVGAWQHTLVDRSQNHLLSFRSDGVSEVVIEFVEYARTADIIANVIYEIPEVGWYKPVPSVKTTILHRVFDITNPLAPIMLRNHYQPGMFEVTEAQRRVVVVGPNAYAKPKITRAIQHKWPLTGADAIYIAPARLLPALTPLVQYRNAQGIATTAIDVQKIYDGWSNGDVDPAAIRAFLQYVAHRWKKVPHTVVLVGDGTVDPLNYTKSGAANVNHIPPYLAEVDDYLGESACESCYVRLDGDNPLTDAAPDMAIGRISVRTVLELRNYINKIRTYERQPLVRWTNQHIVAADDPDSGGDFPYFANTIQSSAYLKGMNAQRFFYDPTRVSSYTGTRIRSATTLRKNFLNAMNAGAALVSYVGHANHFQWASTDFMSSTPYLMNIWDVDGLKNGVMTPIMVSMACLSSAFQRESTVGQTIDERLVFKSTGGAIATWGSAGMEVASGHNQMFYNFYRVLREGNQPIRTLGAATFIGSVYLAASSTCCANVISAYTLIGDPLIRPRITLIGMRRSDGMQESSSVEIDDISVVDGGYQLIDEQLLPTPAALPPRP
ncbi:MAG: C25 family cysteine peptidase [Roseiflexaceae bacterium]